MGSLDGRIAIVTGGGTGIGQGIALAFAKAGAKVVISGRRLEPLQETLSTIQQNGGQGLLVQGDVSKESDVETLVKSTVEAYEKIDILVNNAGNPLQRTSIEDCPTSLWRQALDVNVTSAFFVTRRSIPHLKRSGQGSIINNLSLSVQTGGAGGAGPYAAAKGALQVMTRTLARELAPAVRVNAVMPGVIETRHHEVFSSPERMADYRRQTPLARNGSAEEVAQAILFLASDASSFITGAVIDINGGRFLR
jgi:3-oxoacyl-[acyl-carrier protein] reductase